MQSAQPIVDSDAAPLRGPLLPPAPASAYRCVTLLPLVGVALFAAGCVSPFESISHDLAREARLALKQDRPPRRLDLEEDLFERAPKEEPAERSVLIAELLAIFPGLFWPGIGHQYAGDHRTAKELRGAGGLGYGLALIGGGFLVGGYFAEQADEEWLDPYARSLYIAGGITGGVGVSIVLYVWFYDMIDTPRAIRTRGRPPADSPINRDLRDFGED